MQAFGVALGLASAAVWGAGDFCGGLASRKSHQFQVLTLSALSGLLLLLACAALRGEALPSSSTLFWAGLGGLSGTVGLACLYRGLSLGSAATVAPTAAVITAALPVVFSLITEGRPRSLQLVGFVVAIAGIWLVASHSSAEPELQGAVPGHVSRAVSRTGFRLALFAGVGFGGFLILIAQVPAGPVFVPAAVARGAMLIAVVLLLRAQGQPLPSLTSNSPALVAGVFDAGGNVFYLFAKEYGRLDVAAVLSSLYPVTTVLLAHALSKEEVSRMQWVGMGVCLLAVALITVN
jgi:drug/metabolite transporter (DMT)-like permease